jgi:hypothetical protein
MLFKSLITIMISAMLSTGVTVAVRPDVQASVKQATAKVVVQAQDAMAAAQANVSAQLGLDATASTDNESAPPPKVTIANNTDATVQADANTVAEGQAAVDSQASSTTSTTADVATSAAASTTADVTTDVAGQAGLTVDGNGLSIDTGTQLNADVQSSTDVSGDTNASGKDLTADSATTAAIDAEGSTQTGLDGFFNSLNGALNLGGTAGTTLNTNTGH